VPTDEHKFNLKILDGYKVEFVEVKGIITTVKFIQPNGVFSARKKVD